jgi:ABC-type polysaccharide/polyol phosphate export permease
MLTAAILLRDHNPLRVFALFSLVFFSLVIFLFALVVISLQGKLVINTPFIFAVGMLLMFFSALSFGLGLILNAINTRFRQLKQLLYRNK